MQLNIVMQLIFNLKQEILNKFEFFPIKCRVQRAKDARKSAEKQSLAKAVPSFPTKVCDSLLILFGYLEGLEGLGAVAFACQRMIWSHFKGVGLLYILFYVLGN